MTLLSKIKEAEAKRQDHEIQEEVKEKIYQKEIERKNKELFQKTIEKLEKNILKDIENGIKTRTINFDLVREKWEWQIRGHVLSWLEENKIKCEVITNEVNVDYSGYGARYETYYTTVIEYPIKKGLEAKGDWPYKN